MRPQMSALPKPSPQALLTPGEFALTARDFEDIATMIFKDAGIDLQVAKAPLVYSRLAKRLRALSLSSFREYCDLVASPAGAAERHKMLSALTTNVTRFFREPHHFEHLRDVVLPKLLAGARSGAKIRIWSSACSSGEEPYSVALTLLGARGQGRRIRHQGAGDGHRSGDRRPRSGRPLSRGGGRGRARTFAPAPLPPSYRRFARRGGGERRGSRAGVVPPCSTSIRNGR